MMRPPRLSTKGRLQATAAATAVRSRPVVRRRGGTCGIASVNVFLTQSAVWHRQRRLCHTNSSPSGPYGMSRGRVVTASFIEVDTTPQPGHTPAYSAAVTR